MKSQKVSRIGIVVSDDAVTAVQKVDGGFVRARVPFAGDDLKKSLRKLISSSPFVGRNAALGLEGEAVLVESLAVPQNSGRSAEAICADRLKGDPVFNAENAALGVTAGGNGSEGSGLVMLAAVNKERIAAVMQACREATLEVHAVEAAPLAAWRAVAGSGPQVRLLRGEHRDVVQAGIDGRLLFCRVVKSPIGMPELGATITRAASLLAVTFQNLTVCGKVDPELAALARNLGLELALPDVEVEYPAATGLATEGSILTEFTPPEERVLRARRRVRKVRFSMATAAVVLLSVGGVLGFQKLSGLKAQQLTLEGRVKSHAEAQLELAGLRARLIDAQTGADQVALAIPGHRTSSLWGLLMTSAPPSLLLETCQIDDQMRSGTVGREVLVKLSGVAADGGLVRTYADNLLSTEAFTDVRIEASERVLLAGGVEGERFRMLVRAETR